MRKYTISLLGLFIVCTALGMEKEPILGSTIKRKPAQVQLLTSEIPEQIWEAIYRIDDGGFIGVDMQFLTDKKMIDELINASKRGVTIQVNLKNDNRNNDAIQLFAQNNISVHIAENLHTKRILVCSKKPEEVANELELQDCIVFEGSYNMSNIAHNHKEIMVKTMYHIRYFQEHYNDHKKTTQQWTHRYDMLPRLEHILRQATPENIFVVRNVVNSLDTYWMTPILNLINTLVTGDKIDIVSMTLDDISLIIALKNAKLKGVQIRVFLDPSGVNPLINATINNSGADLLKALEGSIYIWNSHKKIMASKKYPALLHAKAITIWIAKEKKPLTVISSANFTDNSFEQINPISFHPDQGLYNGIQNFIETLRSELIPLLEQGDDEFFDQSSEQRPHKRGRFGD